MEKPPDLVLQLVEARQISKPRQIRYAEWFDRTGLTRLTEKVEFRASGGIEMAKSRRRSLTASFPAMDTVLILCSKHGVGKLRLNTGHGWCCEKLHSNGSLIAIVPPSAQLSIDRTDEHVNMGFSMKPSDLEPRIHLPKERVTAAFERLSTRVFRDDWLQALANEMWQKSSAEPGCLSEVFCQSASLAIAAHLLNEELTGIIKSKRGGIAPQRKRMILEYIDSRISNKISIKELASLCELSEYHFIRAFQVEFGLTPYQYILRIRVRRAIELLSSHPTLGLSEIAFRCGFSSTAALSLQFRRIIGVSPTLYRSQIQ